MKKHSEVEGACDSDTDGSELQEMEPDQEEYNDEKKLARKTRKKMANFCHADRNRRM